MADGCVGNHVSIIPATSITGQLVDGDRNVGSIPMVRIHVVVVGIHDLLVKYLADEYFNDVVDLKPLNQSTSL